MPQIPQYISQTPAQGGIGGRAATGADFGADDGLGELGQGLQQTAGILDAHNTQVEQRQSEDDVTNVRIAIMRAHSDLSKQFTEESLKAPAGDQGFAERFTQNATTYLGEARSVAQTRKGRQTYDLLSNELVRNFSAKAGDFQVQSAGVKAKLDFAENIKYASNSLLNDPFLYGIVRKLTLAGINDPDSTYARKGVPKEALLKMAEAGLARAYVEGLIANDHPEFARRQLMGGKLDDKLTATDKLTLLREADGKILKNENKTKQVDARRIADEAIETGAKRALSGTTSSPIKVAPAVTALSGVVQKHAAATGVDANIMLAQIDAESEGNPAAVSSTNARGVSQFIPGTAKRYGVDVTNVESSISGQARYMSDLLRMFGGDYQKALAGYNWGEGNVQAAVAKHGDNWLSVAPNETKNYVSKIMANVAAKPGTERAGSHDIRAGLDAAYERARAAVQQRYPNDPQMMDLVNSHISTYITRKAKAQEAIQIKANDDLVTETMGLNEQNKTRPITLDELLARPGMTDAFATVTPDQRRGILAAIEHNAKEVNGQSVKSQAAVVEDVFRRVHLPQNDPDKIWNPGQLAPYFTKGLTRADYEWFTKLIDEQRTPEGRRISDVRANFFGGVKRQFDKSTMLEIDQRGGEDNYKFQQFVLDKERELRKSGKDPYELYNPSSPDYAGNYINTFKRSIEEKLKGLQEDLNDMKQKNVSKGSAQAPGETWLQWKERTGRK